MYLLIMNKFYIQITFWLKLILSLTFLISAYTKLISPGIVEVILIDNKIVSTRETAAIFIRFLIASELSIGLLLLQKNYIKKFVLPLTFFFLFTFSVYLFYAAFIISDNQNCGCFGKLIEMSPIESLVKNIFLLIITVILFIKTKNDETKKLPLIILPILSTVFVFLTIPTKSNYENKFLDFTKFENAGRVDLTEGKKLIAIMNTECEHCQKTAYDLSKMKKQFKWFPEIYALYFTEGQVSVDSFQTITNFRVPYNIISARKFFDLVGQSPPRIYYLENGIIKEYWDSDFVKNITLNFATNK